LKSLVRNTVRDAGVYLFLSVATMLMLQMILSYYPLNDQTGFLKFKQEHIGNSFWKTCFYIHVFTSLLVLLAGFTQFSSHILTQHRQVHRFAGRIYAFNILFINFPTALVMGVYANGGVAGKTAFLLLDVLWFAFTLVAVLAIRKGNIRKHREFMIRSFALTLSAISLRTWKMILTNTTDLDYSTIYIMDAWLGFVPNLLLAEWIIRRRRKKMQLAVKKNDRAVISQTGSS
jgi:uncharacterized membrane protein YozB (DUF420 family)